MLTRLFIKNIVLIEACELFFEQGFTVLTGETGAGKSVLLSAIGLLLGQRQDTGLIRQGESHAVVEASFDITNEPEIVAFLQEAGVEHDERSELIIKRELHTSGKGRSFINNSSVQLALLKKIAPYLIEISAQHTHMQLMDDLEPLNILDRFGHLEEERREVQECYTRHLQCKKRLQEHVEGQAARTRLMETCSREIEEIIKAELEEDDDEELFSKYAAYSENGVTSSLLQEVGGMLEKVLREARQKASFEMLLERKKELEPLYISYNQAIEEVKEVAFEISSWIDRLDVPHHEMARMEARLKEIDALKKKYGNTVRHILEWKSHQEKELSRLQAFDESFDALESSLQATEQALDQAAATLTHKRSENAVQLSKLVTRELRELNMPHAEFTVSLKPQERSRLGDEVVHFFLAANRGETTIDIQHGVSGGELARVALSLHSLQSQNKKRISILFDEIDANIGGETASIVGKKLSDIAQGRQVIAVTHFAQVAVCADAHLSIRKVEDGTRTRSLIERLDSDEAKEQEICRMLGGLDLQFSLR